jgi:hypothetical protein
LERELARRLACALCAPARKVSTNWRPAATVFVNTSVCTHRDVGLKRIALRVRTISREGLAASLAHAHQRLAQLEASVLDERLVEKGVHQHGNDLLRKDVT